MYFVMAVTVEEFQMHQQIAASIALFVVNFHHILSHEVESAMVASSLLSFEQFDDSVRFGRVSAQAWHPVGPVSIERTFRPPHLNMSFDLDVCILHQDAAAITEVIPSSPSLPVALLEPAAALPGMAIAGP